MNVRELTLQQMLEHPEREYNPEIWVKVVDRYKKYKDVIFLEKVNSENEYHELFAIYTTNEGIRFINSVSYSGSIVDSGFSIVNYNGNTISVEKPFEKGFIANNNDGRKLMAEWSSRFGYVFSNKLPLSKLEDKTYELPEQAIA